MRTVEWFTAYIVFCLSALALELSHTIGYSHPITHMAVHCVMFPFIMAFGGAFVLCWCVHTFATTQNTAIVEEDAAEEEA